MHERARPPEIHLQAFIESAPVCMAMFDEEMRYLAASRRWVEAYGRGRDELRGISHYELHPDLPARWIEAHRRSLCGEVLGCKEDRWVLSDGSEQWLDWSIHPWRLDSGTVGGIVISAEDITPRVKDQQELNRQANLLREMGRLSKVAGWEHDLESGKTHWTEQVWEILEIPPQPEIGADFAAQFLAPTSKMTRESAFRRLIEKGVEYDLELELTTARGNRKWVRSIAHPIVERGAARKVRGTFQDITARKASEEQFRQLLEAAPDAMIIIDEAGQIQLVNHQTERMFGYPRAEILGRGVEILIPERFRAICDFYRLALQSGALCLEEATTALDVEGRKKGGAEFPVGLVLSPFTHASKSLLILNARDLTEKRKAEQRLQQNEERLRVAQQAAGLGVFEVSLQDGRRTFSPRMYEIFGVPADPCLLAFENTKPLVHPEDQALFQKQRELMLAGRPVHFECRIIRPDGQERWIEVFGNSKRSHSRELAVFIGVCGDITDRKRVQTELEDSVKKLRTLQSRMQAAREEERRAVARELHDQIGQALAALKINLAWLDQHWPANGNGNRDRIHEMVEMIGDAAAWVHKICWQLRPEILDDFGLGAAIEWQTKESLQDAGIEYEVSVPKYRTLLPDHCAVAIFRIFQEALTNVIRHAAAKRCSVRLEEKDNTLVLEIEDDGKGIGENGASSEEKSWGLLGMKERAEMCGANLSIMKNNGRGTTVRLVVPYRESEIGEPNRHPDSVGG